LLICWSTSNHLKSSFWYVGSLNALKFLTFFRCHFSNSHYAITIKNSWKVFQAHDATYPSYWTTNRQEKPPSVRRHPWRACGPIHVLLLRPWSSRRASARTRSSSSRIPITAATTPRCAASRHEPGAGAHAGLGLRPRHPPRSERHHAQHGDPVHHASPSELSTTSRGGAGLAAPACRC